MMVECIHTCFCSLTNWQWECKAEMDSKYRFGHLDVSCEGYDYPDDPYVLRGSCGVSFGGTVLVFFLTLRNQFFEG